MLIIALTSGPKRINNCVKILTSLFNQTVLPDAVYLTLSTDEFIYEEKDLPSDLLNLIKENSKIKLNWVKENTKTMKKVFPILKFLNDDDLIINIDDDMRLPEYFIEKRLAEYYEFKQPIAGGNNPKWHHKTWSDMKLDFWICTGASIFPKKALNDGETFVTEELIKSYNDDFLYTLIAMSNHFYFKPCIELSTHGGIGVERITSFNDNDGMGKTGAYVNDLDVLKLFDEHYKTIKGKSFIKEFGAYNIVLFDSADIAGDNGEYMYKFLQDNYKNCKLTFLISKTCKDYDRLVLAGYNIRDYRDSNLNALLDEADYIVFSKDIQFIMNKIINYKYKCIFLQHGITNPLNNVEFYMKDYISKFCDTICCSSLAEKNLLINEYGIKHVKFIETGLARGDSLAAKSNAKVKTIPNILISFHGRRGEIDYGMEKFLNSEYFLAINTILNSPTLENLIKSGKCTATFMPHARVLKYISLFNIPNYIQTGLGIPFQDLLVNADALITDFSSNAYELAYLNKPTFYFVPDETYIKTNMPQYKLDKFSLFGIGEMFNDLSSLEAALEAVINEAYQVPIDCKLNASEAFMYKDANNCERIYTAMINIPVIPVKKQKEVKLSVGQDPGMPGL